MAASAFAAGVSARSMAANIFSGDAGRTARYTPTTIASRIAESATA